MFFMVGGIYVIKIIYVLFQYVFIMKIIINADDFGGNKYINKKILKCIESENISSTSWWQMEMALMMPWEFLMIKKYYLIVKIYQMEAFKPADRKPLTRNIDRADFE